MTCVAVKPVTQTRYLWEWVGRMRGPVIGGASEVGGIAAPWRVGLGPGVGAKHVEKRVNSVDRLWLRPNVPK